MKRLFVIAIAATTAMTAMPAYAGTQSVVFQGNRAVECSVTGYSGVINFGNLGRTGEASPVTDNGINVFCNRPYTASIKSDNGYLKLQDSHTANLPTDEGTLASPANPGFKAGLDYGLVIGGLLNNTFSSKSAAAGVDYNLGSHSAVEINGASAIYDTFSGGNPLLGGNYKDTVTLTMTPQGF
jgi:spore coat protein U-like protein